jgi:hypothetical protein
MVCLKLAFGITIFCINIYKNNAFISSIPDEPTSFANNTITLSSAAIKMQQRSTVGSYDSSIMMKYIKNKGMDVPMPPNRTKLDKFPTTTERTVVESGMLKVQGRNIVDGTTGTTIYLRGVNMDCYYYFDSTLRPEAQLDWYANENDIQYLKSIQVTSIRLVLHWHYFKTSLGFDLIDQYLEWCSKVGIYIVLDMHVVPPDDDFGY